MGHEGKQPQHTGNIKILHTANRRHPLGYWARVAHISYQEVLREDDCVTWKFHCAILKTRNVYPLKHPSRAHSQATLAAQHPITVQMQRINEKKMIWKSQQQCPHQPEGSRGMAGQCLYHSGVVQAPKVVVREAKFCLLHQLKHCPTKLSSSRWRRATERWLRPHY